MLLPTLPLVVIYAAGHAAPRLVAGSGLTVACRALPGLTTYVAPSAVLVVHCGFADNTGCLWLYLGSATDTTPGPRTATLLGPPPPQFRACNYPCLPTRTHYACSLPITGCLIGCLARILDWFVRLTWPPLRSAA